jgi:hypothetical protein
LQAKIAFISGNILIAVTKGLKNPNKTDTSPAEAATAAHWEFSGPKF